jgi:hypothetical protein
MRPYPARYKPAFACSWILYLLIHPPSSRPAYHALDVGMIRLTMFRKIDFLVIPLGTRFPSAGQRVNRC